MSSLSRLFLKPPCPGTSSSRSPAATSQEEGSYCHLCFVCPVVCYPGKAYCQFHSATVQYVKRRTQRFPAQERATMTTLERERATCDNWEKMSLEIERMCPSFLHQTASGHLSTDGMCAERPEDKRCAQAAHRTVHDQASLLESLLWGTQHLCNPDSFMWQLVCRKNSPWSQNAFMCYNVAAKPWQTSGCHHMHSVVSMLHEFYLETSCCQHFSSETRGCHQFLDDTCGWHQFS